MDLPTPPTDNLYKFKALTGLLSLILITYFLLTKSDSLSIAMFQESHEIAALEKKEVSLQQDEHTYRLNTLNNPQDIGSTNDDKIEGEYVNRTSELNSQLDEIKYKVHLLQYDAFKLIVFGLSGVWGILYFSDMTKKGFKDWETKVQVYQDIILRNEAKRQKKK